MSDAKTPPRQKGRPWPYRATLPQRYAVDVESYKRVGGSIDLESFVKGFLPEGVQSADMTRFYQFSLVFEQLLKEQVPGDLLELGTYQGRTATLLAAMARRMGRTAYVLDTFEGFDQRDVVGPDVGARVGTFSDTSLEGVRALVGDDSVRFVKGYFPDTAKDLPPDATYCLVHIDCDLYAPITSALEYFYPRMAPGGFIIIHDYASPSWAGAERAVDEFFATKPEAIIPMPDGAGSAMIRKLRASSPTDNWLVRRRAESWGVWGLGDNHELDLAIPVSMGAAVDLDLDVHAFLAGTQTTQRVIIRSGGTVIGEWTFDTANNRGVRTVRVPVPGQGMASGDVLPVSVTFHPTALGIPAELNPAASERRPLGLALHRLRMRKVA